MADDRAGELADFVREAFGWDDIFLSAGPRGALGQIWRLDAGSTRYALKEHFGEPPSDTLIDAELSFTRHASNAGVRFPASYPDRDGQYLFPGPAHTWLRMYEWVDVRPVGPTRPAAIGELLARLHRAAPAASVEPDGGAPDPWYDNVPGEDEFASAIASGAGWAARPLADQVSTLPELCAAVAPADPAELILCHRDLHPGNVLADPTGALVVLDWDNLGPAAPGREVARAMFDWFCDGGIADLDAMRALYRAYISEDGPGRITGPADFSMLLACRLNFLLLQAMTVLDRRTGAGHRAHARAEIAESLDMFPTPGQLADVLALSRS